MKDLGEKTLTLRGNGFQQFLSRLHALGWHCERHNDLGGKYLNPDPQANIQQITTGHCRVSPEKWSCLLVQARDPEQVEADLQRLGLCHADDIVTDQQTQAELERELHQAKEYWQQTIRPYIEGPMRDLIQWYVADNAHWKLREAIRNANTWNWTKQGAQFPVRAEAIPNLEADDFHAPQLICKSEELRQKLEAVSPPQGLSPDEAVCWRHELLMSVQRYIEGLPEPQDWKAKLCVMLGSNVTFADITRSNETLGQVPLLPPVPADGALPSSKAAIKQVVMDFFQKQTPPDLTQEEFQHRQRSEPLKGASGEEKTYLEWQNGEHEAINDCLKHERISLKDLCKVREERFQEHGHAPDLITNIRKPQEKKPTSSARPESGEHAQVGPVKAENILRVGRLRYTSDFNQVWLGDELYDLSTRAKARCCIRFLVDQNAFDANSARHLKNEIDPYVRKHAGELLPSSDIKIQHYFTDTKNPKKRLQTLCKEILRAEGRTGRYYLTVL